MRWRHLTVWATGSSVHPHFDGILLPDTIAAAA
jgi:hypothetical protein